MNVHRLLSIKTILIAASLSGCASGGAGRNAWQATAQVDPITQAKHCVIAAYDHVGDSSFSRVGYLYPFVENNSEFGLLVGVSSGGRIRVPVGDILWRVDDKPFRTIRMTDNPEIVAASTLAPTTDPIAKYEAAVKQATQFTVRLSQGAISGSTVSSGPTAHEMLSEMIQGKALLFRSAASAPAFGLPNSNTFAVGQITTEGLKPIPLDGSFRTALADCGIQP